MLDRKITVEECCVIVGCGKSHCYELLNAREIESWLVGHRKRVISENSAYAYVAKKKAAEIAKQKAGNGQG